MINLIPSIYLTYPPFLINPGCLQIYLPSNNLRVTFFLGTHKKWHSLKWTRDDKSPGRVWVWGCPGPTRISNVATRTRIVPGIFLCGPGRCPARVFSGFSLPGFEWWWLMNLSGHNIWDKIRNAHITYSFEIHWLKILKSGFIKSLFPTCKNHHFSHHTKIKRQITIHTPKKNK